MDRKTATGLLLAVWLVLLGAECVDVSAAVSERLTLRDILILAEPALEGMPDAAKLKAVGLLVAGGPTSFIPSPSPGASARQIFEEPLLLEKPPPIYQLHRVFLI